jgi:hypothetical protein
MNNWSRFTHQGISYRYCDDDVHCTTGPAIEYPNGDASWYQNDCHHREDGPAIEHYYIGVTSDSQRRETPLLCWYWHGTPINVNSQEEFERWKRLKAFA